MTVAPTSAQARPGGKTSNGIAMGAAEHKFSAIEACIALHAWPERHEGGSSCTSISALP